MEEVPQLVVVDDSARNSVLANRVYIHNLPWTLTNAQLAEQLSSAGTVRYASIMTHPDGRSKGCAIVEFSSSAESKLAIETLSDLEIDGRKILIREDREPSVAGTARPARGGSGGAMRGGGVRGGYGAGRDGAARGGGVAYGGSGGYPYPRQGDATATAAAVPRAPRPESSAPRSAPLPGSSLYVSNLAWPVTWKDLKDTFAPYSATYADVKMHPDGRSRGFGIVRFATPDNATAAMAALNGTHLCDRPMSIREDTGPKPKVDAAAAAAAVAGGEA